MSVYEEKKFGGIESSFDHSKGKFKTGSFSLETGLKLDSSKVEKVKKEEEKKCLSSKYLSLSLLLKVFAFLHSFFINLFSTLIVQKS